MLTVETIGPDSAQAFSHRQDDQKDRAGSLAHQALAVAVCRSSPPLEDESESACANAEARSNSWPNLMWGQSLASAAQFDA
jgi:hypothetical protein